MTLGLLSLFRTVLLCGALILPAIGCGDDSSDNTSDAGGSGKGGGSGGKGGSGGGSGGKGGSGGSKAGSGGKGGSGGSAAVTCGGSACTPNSTLTMIATTMACCTSDDKCGQTNSKGDCKQQSAPGTKDSKCPTVHVDFMGMDYPQDGCCTPKGKCGGDFQQVGFGCLPREELQSDQGGPLEAISCGSSSNENDGGAEDAGK